MMNSNPNWLIQAKEKITKHQTSSIVGFEGKVQKLKEEKDTTKSEAKDDKETIKALNEVAQEIKNLRGQVQHLQEEQESKDGKELMKDLEELVQNLQGDNLKMKEQLAVKGGKNTDSGKGDPYFWP